VISAGNAFRQEGHVTGTIPKDGYYTMQWQTDSIAKRNELEIWYDGKPHLEVTLMSPQKQKLGPYGPGQTVDIKDESGVRQGRISHRADDPNNHANQIDIRVPFAEEPWTIELKNNGEEVSFHAWIEQGDRGRSRFLADTSSANTLGAISCGESTLTVGAYDTYANACLAPLYDATAAGPTRDNRKKPDVSAPGVRITAAKSLGGAIQMSGTSMAAPHVTGLVALLFQLAERAGLGPLDAKMIQALVREAARRNPPTTREWDPRYGAGRLAGPASLDYLLKQPSRAAVADLKPGPPPGPPAATATTETLPRTDGEAHGSGGNGFQDLDRVIQFLRDQLAGNGHNGSHDLSTFVQTVAAKIHAEQGFRLRVEPLS
jgi:subtilisin family serine protease